MKSSQNNCKLQYLDCNNLEVSKVLNGLPFAYGNEYLSVFAFCRMVRNNVQSATTSSFLVANVFIDFFVAL